MMTRVEKLSLPHDYHLNMNKRCLVGTVSFHVDARGFNIALAHLKQTISNTTNHYIFEPDKR